MKLYLTVESYGKLKRTFTNLNSFYILDVMHVLATCGLDIRQPYNAYIVNEEIKKTICAQAKSKRLEGIIYINPKLDDKIMDGLNEYVSGVPTIEGLVLMDDAYFPKLKDYHHLFEEVLFFPSIKRVKILECHPLKIFENGDSELVEKIKALDSSL